MAPKRVRDQEMADDDVNPSTHSPKPVYLLAPLISHQAAYSVFMVDATAVADGDEPRRANTVAAIPEAEHGMSFVVVHSEQGSWIVGVGGSRGGTLIYEPSTMTTIRGPNLRNPMRKPILFSLGSKVYAISRCPKVRDSKHDLLPWFQYLSFRKGVIRQGCRTWSWKHLRSPPIFPLFLDPLEYRNPPRIIVSSYATIGSHILLSLDDKGAGTFAFHVVEKRWEKLSNESLPFVGQAVPLGGSLFAACCTVDSGATAAIFHMSITGSSSSSPVASGNKLAATLLSTLQCPVVSSVGDPIPLFCPLGKGNFCSIWLGSSGGVNNRANDDVNYLQIMLTSFKIDNVEAILTACQKNSADAKDLQVPVQVKYQNQTYKLHDSYPFKSHCVPFIASLSMDTEQTEDKAREATASNVFEACDASQVKRMKTKQGRQQSAMV